METNRLTFKGKILVFTIKLRIKSKQNRKVANITVLMFSELLQKILENQAVQDQQIKDIKTLLLRTINDKKDGETGNQGLAIPFLPLSTSEELEHLEDWLKAPENFKLLVRSNDKTILPNILCSFILL